MATIAVIGDGPAGLSAALFLARGDQSVTVYGQDETAMHYALLRNYLGIDEVSGSDFQQQARAQIERAGASLLDDEVSEVGVAGDGFALSTASGRNDVVDYLVLGPAKKGSKLAQQLGVDTGADGIEVDTEYRTRVDRVYAIGRLARPNRSQAIISAGAGATAALDILAREAGQDVTDWDSPDT